MKGISLNLVHFEGYLKKAPGWMGRVLRPLVGSHHTGVTLPAHTSTSSFKSMWEMGLVSNVCPLISIFHFLLVWTLNGDSSGFCRPTFSSWWYFWSPQRMLHLTLVSFLSSFFYIMQLLVGFTLALLHIKLQMMWGHSFQWRTNQAYLSIWVAERVKWEGVRVRGKRVYTCVPCRVCCMPSSSWNFTYILHPTMTSSWDMSLNYYH